MFGYFIRSRARAASLLPSLRTWPSSVLKNRLRISTDVPTGQPHGDTSDGVVRQSTDVVIERNVFDNVRAAVLITWN